MYNIPPIHIPGNCPSNDPMINFETKFSNQDISYNRDFFKRINKINGTRTVAIYKLLNKIQVPKLSRKWCHNV